MSSILNEKYVREFALRSANGRFTRVGKCFVDEFAREVERMLAAKVRRHPTKGVTLKASFPNAA